MGGQGTVPRRRRPALAAAALVLAALALAGCSGGERVQASSGGRSGDATSTTAPAGTAASTSTTSDDGLVVRIDHAGGDGTVRVVLDDPAAPALATSRQCVLVTLYDGDGTARAEGSQCNRDAGGAPTPGAAAGADGTVGVTLQALSGPQIGSACTVESVEAVDAPVAGTAPASASFAAVLPAGMAAGTYRVVVDATSGIGNGCPVQVPVPGTSERTGRGEATITLG